MVFEPLNAMAASNPPTWANVVNAAVDATGISRTSGCDGCNAGAISVEQIDPVAGGSFQFVAKTGPGRHIGLTAGHTLGFTAIAYDFAISTWNSVGIYEYGAYRTEVRFTSGDIFKISVSNRTVQYYQNGNLVFTSPTPVASALSAEALLLSLSSRLDNPLITLNSTKTSGSSTLTWSSLSNATADANGIYRAGGCNGCNAGAISTQQISVSSGGSFQFTVSHGPGRFAGLTTSNSLGFSTLNYSIAVGTLNTIEIYELGMYRADIPFSDGDLFSIAVVSGAVKYYRNGTVVFTSPVAPTTPLSAEALLLSLSSRVDNPALAATTTASPTPSPSPTPTPTPIPTTPQPVSSSLSAVWANNGEDKITQDELRATNGGTVVNNSWDGKNIILFGAQNEVVGANLVLEAATAAANNISVQFQTLTGPAGATISSSSPDPANIFNWTNRNIELFFVRYLQIKGLSFFGYAAGWQGIDERIVPKRLERPWTGNGVGTGLWTDRPDHDKFYPDIAVPLELVPTFNIAKANNQSIWMDIYIPRGTPPGLYTGTLTISQSGAVIQSVPVQLTVRPFALPDVPASKTMLFFSQANVAYRLFGSTWFSPYGTAGQNLQLATDRLFQIAHRHKISIIGEDDGASTGADSPSATWVDRLNGTLFSSSRGYAGPGANTGNDIYSILTYAGWLTSWTSGNETVPSEAETWTHANNWEAWFKANSPTTDHFLYLCDECTNPGRPLPSQVNQWAGWLKANPGVGKTLKSFATVSFDIASTQEPLLDYVADASYGNSTVFTNAVASIRSHPGSKIFMYNPSRPYAGSFTIEDDGVALRELAWAQYKMGVDRYFYWESTYYNDSQTSPAHQNNVFENAETFGGSVHTQDPILGEWNYAHTNGEGVLFYPGTDLSFPSDSYNVLGVFASLRLKHWRRGIQDVDYISLAAAKNPAATQQILQQMVPKALWELNDLGGYIISALPYSINPDDWENARTQLAHLIDGQ